MCIWVIEFRTASSHDFVSQKITEKSEENRFRVNQKFIKSFCFSPFVSSSLTRNQKKKYRARLNCSKRKIKKKLFKYEEFPQNFFQQFAQLLFIFSRSDFVRICLHFISEFLFQKSCFWQQSRMIDKKFGSRQKHFLLEESKNRSWLLKSRNPKSPQSSHCIFFLIY